MDENPVENPSHASLRWGILRRSFLPASRFEAGQSLSDVQFGESINNISRKTASGFNLIQHHVFDGHLTDAVKALLSKDIVGPTDICICYTLPFGSASKLFLIQRREDAIELNDFEVSARYKVDTTGIVCCWPSEDVLAYYCIHHSNIFRSKRVLELGSGYGLAGFSIAACTDAVEVIISDGNPQVVDYIQRNISINAQAFGKTKVTSMVLHWNEEQSSEILNSFDIIVASDCTFFKQYHRSLVSVVKSLLKRSETSEAIFLSPRRGDSLHKFLQIVKENELHYELIKNYDATVWNLHQRFLQGDCTSWSNYDEEHCYPVLVRISSC